MQLILTLLYNNLHCQGFLEKWLIPQNQQKILNKPVTAYHTISKKAIKDLLGSYKKIQQPLKEAPTDQRRQFEPP